MRVPSQYVIPPPQIPMFMFKHYGRAWRQLIQWSKDEFQARLVYLSEHGYWKELKKMNEEYSPIRILAELHGYRRMCANMTQKVYDDISGRERVFIRRAYELRDMLLK